MLKLLPQYEIDLLKNGFKFVAGIDEAGRGPWAGPVVAACLMFDDEVKISCNIFDSKKLTAKRRQDYFDWLTDNFIYGVGVVSHNIIDAVGIVPATKLAMKQATEDMISQPDYLFIDAVDLSADIKLPQQKIIKGDQKVWSIAAASIIAKVTRDQIMDYYHLIYPDYGFNLHKGYGTKHHQSMIVARGICPLHRRSFQPIKQWSQGVV